MSFDLYTLMFGFFFGVVGIAALKYGRKTASARHMLLGIVLLVYTYFVPSRWLTALIGVVLTVLLFWP